MTQIAFNIWDISVCAEFLELCDFCNYAITCVISSVIIKTAYVGTFCYVLYLHTICTFLAFYIKKQEVARNVLVKQYSLLKMPIIK